MRYFGWFLFLGGAINCAYANDFCLNYDLVGTFSFSPAVIVSQAKGNRWGLGGLTGHENLEVLGSGSNQYLRIHFPKGSYDPGSMRRLGLPIGGANFFIPFSKGGFECATLKYKVRFPSGFYFVKGGKLLGLYGGEGNSGGRVPNGYDGFSFRVLWKESGVLALYSYVPGIKKWGDAGRVDNFYLTLNKWESISLSIQLNDLLKSNGKMKLISDSGEFYLKSDVFMRKTADLKIDGLFFSTFFGGNSEDFSTPVDTYIDFYEISVEGYR